MKKLKIALLQIAPTGTIESNLLKGIEYCKEAKKQGADIALFLEMWSCGYCIPEDISVLKSMAVSMDGEFVNAFSKMAEELEMAIGITILEQHDPLPRNTICLFDRRGKLQYTYAKVHTCDFGDECRLDAGEDFYVAELDTVKGVVRTG